MCGIAGFIGPGARQKTQEMICRIRHRGPDGIGIWSGSYNGQEAALGHAHLKIVGDICQPVSSDGMAITYNGELYNFQEFLQTDSDTEALAREILKNGIRSFIESAGVINGDYAFALLDNSGLSLARDPVGVKPLYYGTSDDGFGFASEPKALRAAGIHDIVVLSPGSVYSGGCQRKVTAIPAHDPQILDEQAAIAMLEPAFIKAVRSRVHSNSAVAFSGGIDCSLIGAIASGLPLCTVGLKGSHDVRAARHAAKLMGSEKRHIVYEVEEKEVSEVLPEVIYAVESYDPMTVSIAIPVYILAREVRRSGYRVLLSGQGADELFAGYARYEESFRNGRLAEELDHDLRHIYEVNLERDDAATMAHGVELRVPYLDMSVINIAQKIDPSLKVYRDSKDYIRKYILRKMSKNHLPHEISFAPKKAIQYGTSVQKSLERLARDNGYKGDLTGYFKSLYEVVL